MEYGTRNPTQAISATPPECADHEVGAQVKSNQNLVKNLHASLDALEGRLEPILVVVPTNSGGQTQPMAPGSPLVNELRESNAGIELAVQRISHILNRCQL